MAGTMARTEFEAMAGCRTPRGNVNRKMIVGTLDPLRGMECMRVAPEIV